MHQLHPRPFMNQEFQQTWKAARDRRQENQHDRQTLIARHKKGRARRQRIIDDKQAERQKIADSEREEREKRRLRYEDRRAGARRRKIEEGRQRGFYFQ